MKFEEIIMMQVTQHAQKRMTKRGFTKDMIDFTLDFGETKGDRWVLNRKMIEQSIGDLERKLRTAKKLRDKGGIVVVAEGESLLTAYDFDSRKMAY